MGDYSEYIDRSLRSVQGIVNNIIAKRRYPGNTLLSFEHIHFRKTQLYLAIREWEKANEPFMILNAELS